MVELPKTPLDLYNLFLAQKNKLYDYSWLYETIRPHCKFKKIPGLQHCGPRRIIQVPSEFTKFLLWMNDKKIKSYLEIGISTGGSFFTTDAYLRNVNEEYQYSYGLDIREKCGGYIEYNSKFSTCQFVKGTSQEVKHIDFFFDLCFIDANHTEKCSLEDFDIVKERCKYVAFHDIVLDIDEKYFGKRKSSTVFKTWNKLKEKYNFVEFIDKSLPETCGIGIIEM
jgi:hypothetical protein